MSKKRQGNSFRLAKAVGVVLAGATLFGVYMWLHASVPGFELPKTALLRLRHMDWETRIGRIDQRLDHCERALEDLQVRDEKIYRAVYCMDSVPDSVRNAGLSGRGRYAWMSGTDRNGRLARTSLRLDRLTKKAYVQSLSYDQVDSIARVAGDMATHIPAICPLDTDPESFLMTSPFGYRNDPISGEPKLHAGMDFACPPGNPVYATGDGIVEMASDEYHGYGNIVIINHGFGYKSRYAHLEAFEVSEGMHVERGTRVGTTGRSGRVTGPHLHYEIYYKDVPVNPARFMDLNLSPEDYGELILKAGGGMTEEEGGPEKEGGEQ